MCIDLCCCVPRWGASTLWGRLHGGMQGGMQGLAQGLRSLSFRASEGRTKDPGSSSGSSGRSNSNSQFLVVNPDGSLSDPATGKIVRRVRVQRRSSHSHTAHRTQPSAQGATGISMNVNSGREDGCSMGDDSRPGAAQGEEELYEGSGWMDAWLMAHAAGDGPSVPGVAHADDSCREWFAVRSPVASSSSGAQRRSNIIRQPSKAGGSSGRRGRQYDQPGSTGASRWSEGKSDSGQQWYSSSASMAKRRQRATPNDDREAWGGQAGRTGASSSSSPQGEREASPAPQSLRGRVLRATRSLNAQLAGGRERVVRAFTAAGIPPRIAAAGIVACALCRIASCVCGLHAL